MSMDLDSYLRTNSISGTEFAAQLAITEASLSRIRRGNQNISRDLIGRIFELTGGAVSLTALVFPPARDSQSAPEASPASPDIGGADIGSVTPRGSIFIPDNALPVGEGSSFRSRRTILIDQPGSEHRQTIGEIHESGEVEDQIDAVAGAGIGEANLDEGFPAALEGTEVDLAQGGEAQVGHAQTPVAVASDGIADCGDTSNSVPEGAAESSPSGRPPVRVPDPGCPPPGAADGHPAAVRPMNAQDDRAAAGIEK